MAGNTDAKGKRLVVEYHYEDGDVGAYRADEDRTTRFCAQTLWEYFSVSGSRTERASHITIRMEANDEK